MAGDDAVDDLFGEALYAYSKGDYAEFSFVMQDGTVERFPLQRYFRTVFTALEQEMIGLARGDILDVGCATGYYVPALMERGVVTAIDISPGALRVAHEVGLPCIQADVWGFELEHRYDTITLFENNLGIAGTVTRAKLMLLLLKAMLKPGGQILLQQWDLRRAPYAEVTLRPLWKGVTGKRFPWVHISPSHLHSLARECGLAQEVIRRSGNYALIRLFPRSP